VDFSFVSSSDVKEVLSPGNEQENLGARAAQISSMQMLLSSINLGFVVSASLNFISAEYATIPLTSGHCERRVDTRDPLLEAAVGAKAIVGFGKQA
jgi:hypothetical protein